MTDSPNRIAIISDIHANLTALTAVLDKISDLKVDAIFCCGDIVGYGGSPNECVSVVREREIPTVLGNHDQASLDLIDMSTFNVVARKAMQWTQDILTKDNREFLNALPLTYTASGLLIVHASPFEPAQWHYILTMGEAQINFGFYEEQICCVGHSHQPFILEKRGDKVVCCPDPAIEILPDCKYLINVGSVGQPRDQNPAACFALCDSGEGRMELLRVEYDIAEAQEAILSQGLPHILALRLESGC